MLIPGFLYATTGFSTAFVHSRHSRHSLRVCLVTSPTLTNHPFVSVLLATSCPSCTCSFHAGYLVQNGADVEATADDAWTALHYSGKHGHSDIGRLLITRGADVNAQKVCKAVITKER